MTGNGRYVVRVQREHRCDPPTESSFGSIVEEPGTTWECGDCGTVWRVYDEVLPRGHTNRKAWVRLNRLHAWWVTTTWRRRHRTRFP